MNQAYSIMNIVNGKCYIGITTQSVEQRWREHVSRFKRGERNHKLYQAFRKYGIQNFMYKSLVTVSEGYDLKELERCLIKDFDTYRNGYNMTEGGDLISDETKEKIRQKMIGREITWAHKIVATRRAQGVWAHGEISGADHVAAKAYEIRCPDGSVVEIKGLRQFCRKYSLDHKTLLDTLKGKQTHHKGFCILRKLIDHPEREYSQVAGNGAHPKQDNLPEIDLADFV